jgi:hypothetical protein
MIHPCKFIYILVLPSETCDCNSKENIIGERVIAAKVSHANVNHSDLLTPMQSDDSGRIVMRKVSVKKRPEWQDINHQDFRGGGGGGAAARPQYIERRRPHRISIRTPDTARDILMRELERAEAIVKRGKKSPKQAVRKAVDELGSELSALRQSLGSTHTNAAGVPENDTDLVASIDALSSMLDNRYLLVYAVLSY